MASTETSGVSVRTIAVEPLTQDAFAPFGDVLEPRGEALPHVYGDTMDVYQPGMHECDVETEFIVTRYRLPMGGAPFVLTVAAPDAPLENGLPVLDSVRAFLVPGEAAAAAHRGTWHEVPLPLVDNSLTLLTSHHGVTSGWAELDEEQEIHKGDTDEEKLNVTDRSGVVLMLDLPAEYKGDS